MLTQPSDEAIVGLGLHARFIAADPTARSEIFDRYYHWLDRQLQHWIERKGLFLQDEDIDGLRSDAIVDCFAGYLNAPEKYSPAKRTLAGYLRMAAEGDFLNLFEAAVRRSQRLGVFVRLDHDLRNRDVGDDRDGIAAVEDAQSVAELFERFASLTTTAEERSVLQLMALGERATEVYAQAIGLSDLPPGEQARRVNVIKDRLNKRIKRHPQGISQ